MMTSDLPWGRAELLLSTVAASAIAEVHGIVVDHATFLGPSGIIVRLRAQARDLAQSAIGRDQVRSCAFEMAADDLAWGRAPLSTWRTFALDSVLDPEGEPIALAASQTDAAIQAEGRQLARDIERQALSSRDAFDAIRGLAAELGAAAQLQALLWRDPRIKAPARLRAIMRASIEPLQRRIGGLTLDSRPPSEAARQTARPISAWRKLFGGHPA